MAPMRSDPRTQGDSDGSARRIRATVQLGDGRATAAGGIEGEATTANRSDQQRYPVGPRPRLALAGQPG